MRRQLADFVYFFLVMMGLSFLVIGILLVSGGFR